MEDLYTEKKYFITDGQHNWDETNKISLTNQYVLYCTLEDLALPSHSSITLHCLKQSAVNKLTNLVIGLVGITSANKMLLLSNDMIADLLYYSKFKSYQGQLDNLDTIVTLLGNNVAVLQSDINKSYIKFNTQELINKIGTYSLNANDELTFSDSNNWNYNILPVEQLRYIMTTAGKVGASSKIPAIIYLTDSEPITSNVITDAWEFGTIPTSISSITRYENRPSIPSTAKYAIINSLVALTTSDDYILMEKNQEVYNDVQLIKEELKQGKTLVVRKTPQTGEYSTLAGALAVATGNDTIIIHEGVYEENHLTLPKGITIKGIGAVEIRGSLAANTAVNTILNYSTLECYNGATLENLHITAKNMRYPIHADFSDGNAIWNVKNCVFEHYGNKDAYDYQVSLGESGNPDGIVSACSAWGGGTKGGDIVNCVNCKFISVARAFSTHNNADNTYQQYGASKVFLQDCEMISRGIDRDGTLTDLTAPLFVQSLDCPVDNCEVIIDNCKLNGYVVFQNSGGDGWSNRLRVFGGNPVKQCFSAYGSGPSSIASGGQITTYASHYTKYPLMDNIVKMINRGSSTIGIGKAVRKAALGGVASYDNTSDDVFGVALEEIAVGGIGDVCISGYLSRIYLDGIRTTNITEDATIYVDVTGSFALTGSKQAFVAVDNQNVVLW